MKPGEQFDISVLVSQVVVDLNSSLIFGYIVKFTVEPSELWTHLGPSGFRPHWSTVAIMSTTHYTWL